MAKKRLLSTTLSAGALLLTAMGMATTGLAQVGASKVQATYGKPAAIHGEIRDWYARDDRSLYLRASSGRWYLATLSGPCPDLTLENTIRFETDALGRFDSWGVVVTRNYRCSLSSLVTSPAPAEKGGRPHSG